MTAETLRGGSDQHGPLRRLRFGEVPTLFGISLFKLFRKGAGAATNGSEKKIGGTLWGTKYTPHGR